MRRYADRIQLGQGEAAEQRDAADEGRLEAGGSIIVGAVIVKQGEVVRPSQLIASVGPTKTGGSEASWHHIRPSRA